MDHISGNFRNKVSILSFVLAVLIVLRHSSGIGVYTLPNWLHFVESYTAQGTDIVVPVFYALSGFLFFTNLDWKDFPRKLRTRFKSLFVPYIIWNLIGYLCVLTICHIPQIAGRINTSLPPFELGPSLKAIFWETEYNITWFIRDLMIFIIFAPIFKLLNTSELTGGGTLLVLIALGFYYNNSIVLYSVTFYMGGYFADYYSGLVSRRNSKVMAICSFAFLLISIFVQTLLDIPQGASIVWLRLIQIPLLWCSADLLPVDFAPRWWMKTSFLIYVSHHMILEPLEKVVFLVLGNNTKGAIIDFIFAPTITVLLILCIAKLLQRYTPNLYRVLNGGRAV